jgi:hypothetical protein
MKKRWWRHIVMALPLGFTAGLLLGLILKLVPRLAAIFILSFLAGAMMSWLIRAWRSLKRMERETDALRRHLIRSANAWRN